MKLVRPASVEEAIAAAQERGAAYVAGGTNLVPDVLFRRKTPSVAVDISRLRALRCVEERGGRVRIGALTTVTDLLASDLIRREAAPLHESAQDFAGPLVRNRATVGGNLLDASPAADLAPPLLALDGEAELLSAEGERRLPLREFFLDYRKTAVRPGELLAAVSIRPLGPEGRSAYCKLQLRRAMAISVVSAAVALWMEGETCVEAGVGMGAVSPVPYRSEAAEAHLRGRRIGVEEIVAASAAAREEARPIDDVRASAGYRRRMCEVVVRRLLGKALGLSVEPAAPSGR